MNNTKTDQSGSLERVGSGTEAPCEHSETYYNAEHDNWYCSKCKRGMGEKYYLANSDRMMGFRSATDKPTNRA